MVHPKHVHSHSLKFQDIWQCSLCSFSCVCTKFYLFLLNRFAQREIEAGVVSNVLVEAAGQAQSPPPPPSRSTATAPVPPPRRKSSLNDNYEADVRTPFSVNMDIEISPEIEAHKTSSLFTRKLLSADYPKCRPTKTKALRDISVLSNKNVNEL